MRAGTRSSAVSNDAHLACVSAAELLRHGSPPVIATLGPSGTSSQLAALRLRDSLSADLGLRDDEVGVALHDEFEYAISSVKSATAAAAVIPGAYPRIRAFYMDLDLELAGAFILDTPLYGIATASPRNELPPSITLTSHRATEHLVQPMLAGAGLALHGEVQYRSSTSRAAADAADNLVDAALTNSTSAALHGLRFITPTMPIRMVWSVFCARNSNRPLLPSVTIVR